MSMDRATTRPREISIEDQAIATLSVPGYPDFLAADGRGVWTTNVDRVEKLEIDRADPVKTIEMPGPCGGMVVVEGSIWVASCRDLAVYRLDIASGSVVARIPTGLADPEGELSLAAGAGSVWVLSSATGILARIDQATNEVVAEVPVLANSCAAAFDFGAVWTTSSGSDRAQGWVQRIDTASNSVAATIRVGPVPRFLAAGEGAVWTLNWADGSVTRIDPATNQQVITFGLGMEGGGGDIATGGGAVWVRGTKVLLAAVDPTTNEVTTIYGPPAGSGAVRVAGDLVWVTAHDTNKVWVLRPGHQSLNTNADILPTAV